MACTAADKAEKPRIPEINWSANNSSAVWALLAKIEKNENYHVLYGKKNVAEVSVSIPSAWNCPMQLVNRIQAVKPRLLSMPGLPKLCSLNYLLLTPTPFMTTSRTSSKGKDLISWVGFLLLTYDSSLKNVYKKHAKQLYWTGEGVQGDEDASQGSEETLSFYIMGDGPCVETPLHAVNIWSALLYLFI
jgi:hypothetical protein